MGVAVPPSDEYWMQQALIAARQAMHCDEVPVGAVLVQNNQVLASANNCTISSNDPTAHAEIITMRAAAQTCKNYRLISSTLYVTLEPCMMCAGAMLHARIKRLVFGAYDLKTGVAGGCFDWLMHAKHAHKIIVRGGVLEEDCSALLKEFFAQKRQLSN